MRLSFPYLFVLGGVFFASFLVTKALRRDVASDEGATFPMVGLKSLPLVARAEGFPLKAGIEIRTGCHMGEVEAMEMDLAHSTQREFIWTLEGVVPGDNSFAPIVKRLPTSALTVGVVSEEFLLSRSTSPQGLGFYICSDNKKTGHCNDKGFSRVDDVVVKNAQTGVSAGYEPTDRIYAFNYLIWDGSEKLGYVDGLASTAESFQALSRNVSPAVARTLPRVQSLSLVLSSFPLANIAGKLNFTLAAYRKESCH